MKTILTSCSALASLILLGGCAGPEHHGAFSALPDSSAQLASSVLTNTLDPALLEPSHELFTLGPGDRVELEILAPPTPSSRTVTTVGPDGKIYFQLLPGLDVWGLTLEQTRALLEKELAAYVKEPRVEVTLREVGSKYVWLLGRLDRPGIYPIQGPTTLLEAIGQAGGTARSRSDANSVDLADLRHSFVLRNGQVLPVNFSALLHGDTSQNIVLRPDDFVFVPSALEQEVYVLGAVAVPHAVPYLEPMTLTSALAGTGGPIRWDFLSRGGEPSVLMRDAYLSHVTIVRGSLAQPQVIIVDFGAIMKGSAADVTLEAGDIVYVPDSPYRFLKNYVNLIVNTFVSTVAANEGIHAGTGGRSTGVGISTPLTGGR